MNALVSWYSVEARAVAVDHGAADGEPDPVAVPQAHDLDVLADHRPALREVVVDEPRDLADEGLGLGERRVPDAERGVVRAGDLRVAGAEDVAEVGRPDPEPAVDDQAAVLVQVRDGLAEVVVGGLDRDRVGREEVAVELLGGPAVDQQVDRPDRYGRRRTSAGTRPATTSPWSVLWWR